MAKAAYAFKAASGICELSMRTLVGWDGRQAAACLEGRRRYDGSGGRMTRQAHSKREP